MNKTAIFISAMCLVLLTACGEKKVEDVPSLDQYKEIVANKASIEKEQKKEINDFINSLSQNDNYTLLNSEISKDGVFISFELVKDNNSYIGAAYGVVGESNKIEFINYKINEISEKSLMNNILVTGQLQTGPPRKYTIIAGITNDDAKISKVKLLYDRKEDILSINNSRGDFMKINIGSDTLKKIKIFDTTSTQIEEVLANEIS